MRVFAGKTLQLIAMVTVGTALFHGVVGDDMGKEFLFLGIGVVIFAIGTAVEGRRPGGL